MGDTTGEFDILVETDHDKEEKERRIANQKIQGKKKKPITNKKRIKKTFKKIHNKKAQRKIERNNTVKQLKAILSDREKDPRYIAKTNGRNYDFKYRCCGMLEKAI